MFVREHAYNAVEKYCKRAKETDMKAETNEKKELTPGTQTMQQAAAVSSPLFESGGEFVLPD